MAARTYVQKAKVANLLSVQESSGKSAIIADRSDEWLLVSIPELEVNS